MKELKNSNNKKWKNKDKIKFVSLREKKPERKEQKTKLLQNSKKILENKLSIKEML
jgi:hypothetical protein